MVVLVFSVLSIPLLMKWHYQMLILSWNASISPFLFPGRPYLWMFMAVISCFFAVLSRATDPNKRFLSAPAVTVSLLFTLAVVFITALLTGGITVRALGAERYGGKGYFYIALAIMGYFAFISQQIPTSKAKLYIAMFFLPGITAVVSNLAYIGGPAFYFLYELFPPENALNQVIADNSMSAGGARINGMVAVAQSIWCLLLAFYGVEGLFDFRRPWRMGLFALAAFGCTLGGFRSAIVFLAMVYLAMCVFEKLWRSARVVMLSLAAVTAMAVVLLLFVHELPLSAQRAISFLPLDVDPIAKQNAIESTEWRVEMWRAVLPDVPKYFFSGKGYSMDPNDLFLANESATRGFGISAEAMIVGGDYHNGPLSVIIPFGVYGAVGFCAFFITSWVALFRNYRYGAPELQRINTFLLALLTGHIVFFFLIFGAIYSDLYRFVGIVGLSIALNGGVRRPQTQMTAYDEVAEEVTS